MNCPEESVLAAAIAKGNLPNDLCDHLPECAACTEAHATAIALQRMAGEFATEPTRSAASMWWLLNLRTRRQYARRAQRPLFWMARIVWIAIAAFIVFAIASVPSAAPALAIGIAGLVAAALPVLIALWIWSRFET